MKTYLRLIIALILTIILIIKLISDQFDSIYFVALILSIISSSTYLYVIWKGKKHEK